MCGIVGAWREGVDLRPALVRARDRLRHRGPDDDGLWVDLPAGLVFGHTRLAIQDLSQAGHQPMASACGRYRMVFNGEIYNHLELRARLESQHWRGHSDSETLMACFRAWGMERTLTTAVGMFALAVFDTETRTLYLARDRFGEKPLYYGYVGRAFAFASELKALRTLPGFDATVDRVALQLYMQCSYVPSPRSIYAGVRKLTPGTWLELTAQAAATGVWPEPKPYWSAAKVAIAGERDPHDVGDAEAIDGLERVLGDAVRGQMISDVPLGAFLSGGIDSSSIVALMQSHASRPVRTFSIGFGESDFDESRQARRVAEHLGTDHTELIVRPEDALALVPSMPHIYDEPFADPSQLPTCLVASLARRHVTVALSGDGGDELFGGYNRHFLAARNWPRIAHLPRTLRRGLASGLRSISSANWDRLAAVPRLMSPARHRVRRVGEKLHKIADVLACDDGQTLYWRLVNHSWEEPLVSGYRRSDPGPHPHWHPLSELAHQMMLADAVTYLPDDILVKVDRAAMAVGLETRVPMLDHRVFEYAWRLPMHMKVRGGVGKWLLRELLCRYVPKQLVERPKMGFAVPLYAWLRGPLRDWAEGLIEESRLRSEGYLDVGLVRSRWQEQLSGRHNWQYQLWNVLMFEAWLEAGG
jgi:asparagine synthase (glutamine-hydrolysing)